MYVIFRSLVQKLLSIFGLGLITQKKLKELHESNIYNSCIINKLDFFSNLKDLSKNSDFSAYFASTQLLKASKSETGQDFFALYANNFKRYGTFLEFGAFDGVNFSNSFLLEKQFEWVGLLIEPVPNNFKKINFDRKCQILNAAVTPYKSSFVKILEPPASNLSYITNSRNIFKRVHKVPAFTLEEILDKYFYDCNLDFLSIDIEGNDFEILKSVDLKKRNIQCVSVEHNNRDDSQEIVSYMKANGYQTVWRKFSKNDFWFAKIP